MKYLRILLITHFLKFLKTNNYHFFETNKALFFTREITLGMRLDIPAGTAIRFEPGDSTEVKLVPYSGYRNAFGFNALINGPLDS